MNKHIIKTDGKDMVILPLDEYEALIEKLEDYEDMKTVKEHMDNPNEEMFPHEIIVRIFDNEENRLRVFREYRNLSVDELAEKAEVSSSHIRNIENSQRVGTYEVLKKLAEALNLDVEDVGG